MSSYEVKMKTIKLANSMQQLQENISARQVKPAPDVPAEIEQIHLRYPNPG
jgi:hypothetical protein